MKYLVEDSLRNFKAWSGGADTMAGLSYDEIGQVEELIEMMYPDEPPTDTEVNDFLWFERDEIAQHLGYSDWEHFTKGEDEDEEEDEEDEEEDI